MIVKFKSRKEASEFLKTKGVDTSKWTEEKWQFINTSQAEIHIQVLAESVWDAMNESTPRQLEAGMWHYPFHENMPFKVSWEDAVKISVARAARLSYMTFDGEIDYEKDIKLHDQLLESKHYSPFEHCARAMSNDEYFEFARGRLLVHDGYGDGDSLSQDIDNNTQGWCNNFRSWISYRYMIENGRYLYEEKA